MLLITELLTATLWYFTTLIIAVGHYPLAALLFKQLPDTGWSLTRILGNILITYLVWILVTLKIIQFNQSVLIITVIEMAVLWYISIKVFKFSPTKLLLSKKKFVIFEELLFLILFSLYLFIRSNNPDINNLEKFMDLGFINAISNSKVFPPHDMWMAGKSINYYYFGHLMTATLSKISFIPTSIVFNLQLATIFGLVGIETFSIMLALTKNYLSSILTPILIEIAGNLHPLTILKVGSKNYWYATASRLDKFVINEFPSYSFVVADLHAHLMGLPIVLLVIAILLQLVLSQRINFQSLLLLSLVLGASYMTNSWDFPIYLGIAFIVILTTQIKKSGQLLTALIISAKNCGVLAVLSVLLFIPFYLSFKPFVSGIDFVHNNSTITNLFTMWGFHFFLLATFIVLLSLKLIDLDIKAKFILSIAIIGVLLITIPEIIYVKDIYTNNYYRANTVFKLYYQAWVLLSLVGGFTIYKFWPIIFKRFSFITASWLSIFLLLSLVVLSYPLLAVKSNYFTLPRNYKSIDGEKFLSYTNIDDYLAIKWLRENTQNNAVIVEAVGNSFSNFGRISTFTGRPTILGWINHEWLWRGSPSEPSLRINDVKEIYLSDNLVKVKELLDKYKVKYIYIGQMEINKYGQIDESRFMKLGAKLVYNLNLTKIYQF